jgi:hypothetical protein
LLCLWLTRSPQLLDRSSFLKLLSKVIELILSEKVLDNYSSKC